MKKLIAAALSLCIVGGSLPVAYSGAPEYTITANARTITGSLSDTITYTLDSNGTLTINGTGATPDYKYVPWDVEGYEDKEFSPFKDDERIINVIIEDGITSIGSGLFYYCNNIESISLNDSIEKIGNGAFSCCFSLNEISLPDSVNDIAVEAFYGCGALKTISIPDSVKEIKYRTFMGCINLETVKLPASLEVIGQDSFSSSALKSIDIPNTVNTIGSDAFNNCKNLSTVDIPESVTNIGWNAFQSCPNLRSVTIWNPDTDLTSWHGDGGSISNGSKVVQKSDGSGEYVYYYDGVIKGMTLSTIHEYADENGYYFVPLDPETPDVLYKCLGKINNDEKISVADAAEVLKECAALANKTTFFTAEQRFNADLDFNNKVTVNDASLVLRYCAYLAKGPQDAMNCKEWLASINVKPDDEIESNSQN